MFGLASIIRRLWLAAFWVGNYEWIKARDLMSEYHYARTDVLGIYGDCKITHPGNADNIILCFVEDIAYGS